MSDLDFLKGLKSGDRLVVEKIYDIMLPKVTRWVMNNSGNKSDAHDLFHETLETILLKVDNIHSSFEGMVMTISKNKWTDKIRKKTTSEKCKAQLTKFQKNNSGINQISFQKENHAYAKHKLMDKYFSELSTICQEVIILLKQGHTVREIIDLMNFNNANTLYRRKAACIERWTTLIKQDVSYLSLFG